MTGAQREEKKKEKYKDWLQRKKLTRIQEQFKKGITKKQIKLEELATIEGQRKVLKALFEPLVHDKGLLEIIIANKHKLKNRFAYKMNIRDKQNVLGTINDIGNRTPDEIWDTYGRNLTYRPGRVITQGEIESDAMRIKLPRGSAKQYKSTGIIKTVTIEISFQKG